MKRKKTSVLSSSFFSRHKVLILLLLILVLHIFFRVYQLEERNEFRWDQVDNAWVAKDIIIDKKFPLLGAAVKQNSGFFLGPGYYYLITPFYWLFGLDPIASGVFAAVTSVCTILVLFFITKKVFSFHTAIIASFIYAISFYIIEADRVQWQANFIPPISLLIFYSLYKVCTGSAKHLLLLALMIGISFHVHFTSIFYPVILLLSIPFFPKKRDTVKYALISLPLFFIWFVPHIISELVNKNEQAKNVTGYMTVYYHGFHLRRFLQLANDAFIEFGEIIFYKPLKFLRFIFYPLFCLVYLKEDKTRNRVVLCYLIGLWILVPWIGFSTYKGEIVGYYFSMTRLFAVIIVAYLLMRLFSVKQFAFKMIGVSIIVAYTTLNINAFFNVRYEGLIYHRQRVLEKIRQRKVVEFRQGVHESYLYYYYTKIKGMR